MSYLSYDYNLNDITKDSSIWILGKPCCGKTTLVANMLQNFMGDQQRNIYKVMFYCHRIPEIINKIASCSRLKYGIKFEFEVKKFYFHDIQELLKEHHVNRNKASMIVVFDDITHQYFFRNSNFHMLQSLINDNVNKGITFIFASSNFRVMPACERDHFDYIFVFKESLYETDYETKHMRESLSDYVHKHHMFAYSAVLYTSKNLKFPSTIKEICDTTMLELQWTLEFLKLSSVLVPFMVRQKYSNFVTTYVDTMNCCGNQFYVSKTKFIK